MILASREIAHIKSQADVGSMSSSLSEKHTHGIVWKKYMWWGCLKAETVRSRAGKSYGIWSAGASGVWMSAGDSFKEATTGKSEPSSKAWGRGERKPSRTGQELYVQLWPVLVAAKSQSSNIFFVNSCL